MFDSIIDTVVFIGVAAFMVSVSISLERIARELQVLSGRHDPKPPVEDPERLIDA